MSSTDQKAARACDNCMRRRARWYCAADDAFLCQACDTSVHSANPLARRHERLRLRASSPLPPPPPQQQQQSVEGVVVATTSKRQGVAPVWSKRKARTRRPQVKSVEQLLWRRLVVPEVAVGSPEERKAAKEEEQLLYRVPIFDPALAEFCSPPPTNDAAATNSCCREDVDGSLENTKEPAVVSSSPVQQLPDSFANFGPTDAELREFTADMEALLGQGLDDSNELKDSFYMETLGLMSPVEDCGRVKVEVDGVVTKTGVALLSGAELKSEASDEVLDIDFNCSSPTVADDDGSFEQKISTSNGDADSQFFKRSLDLRLNYETIIENWGSSPWTDGRRPNVQLDDFWFHNHSGMWAAVGGRQGESSAGTPIPRMDGWREARVSRYREKRRTRLFAKKIRYEVRKLNAEKRPRMKGRFVKRPAGGGAAAAAVPCAVA